MVSFSRAALLATGIMGMTFIWLNRRHKGYEFFVVVIAVIAFLLYAISSEELRSFFTNAVIRTDFGDAGRGRIIIRSLTAVFGQPLLIVLLFGVGNFITESTDNFLENYLTGTCDAQDIVCEARINMYIIKPLDKRANFDIIIYRHFSMCGEYNGY